MRRSFMNRRVRSLLLVLGTATVCRADVTNLIVNGSFERSSHVPGAPDDWACAGNQAIEQRLVLDKGHAGKRSAKLQCTAFSGNGPDFHAMISQSAKIGVAKDHWYRFTFWSKAEGIASGMVYVALVNTNTRADISLSEVFVPGPQWEQFEFRFRAQSDLPATVSRLQFWFPSTGTLWLDEMALVESAHVPQWFPQISTDGVRNFVPNSSFECGREGWGSMTYGSSPGGGDPYRLEGELDGTTAHHGKHSLRIGLSPETLPVFWLDHYDPIRKPVRCVLTANRGWFRVTPGVELTLSAFLRADRDGVVAQMLVNQASGATLRREVRVVPEWQRYTFTFTPGEPFFFLAIGPDLDASMRESATLWLDAIQMERGGQATAYEPRHPVESFVETSASGNIFTDTSQGVLLTVRAFNDTGKAQSLRGTLTVEDFSDRVVFRTHRTIRLPVHSGGEVAIEDVCRRQRGYFRSTWRTAASSNALRIAALGPSEEGAADSPFGFNHAYPWDFLVRLAGAAGVTWWRDWSAKWQTVELERGKFDFTPADQQIDRVLGMNGEVDALLPYPSASWSTTAPEEDVEKAAGGNASLRPRLALAGAPNDPNDFGAYAAGVVRHYRQGHPRPVTHYEILNEPIITSYALPRTWGYTLADYLHLLAAAFGAMKREDPRCRVIGGMGDGLDSPLTREFVTKGGLEFADILDLHMYNPPRPAESFETSFQSLEALMSRYGTSKTIWITEWGCYADDDPPSLPLVVGDRTMNLCRWPSERAATEHIVKFTAVALAHGVRRIFFHAGSAGRINRPDASGVLFEYGGAPRKMYAGVAALSRCLGVPDAFLGKVERGGFRAYVFRTKNQVVAVAWCPSGQTRGILLPPGLQAYDIMGNELRSGRVTVGGTPMYIRGKGAEVVTGALAR